MTLPVQPFQFYFSKFCAVAKNALLTQLWVFLLYLLFAGLSGMPPFEIIAWLSRGILGGFAIIALQLLLSMAIRNFAVPVLWGLGGGIAGLLLTSHNAGLYWPYSLMIMGMNSNKTEDMLAGSFLPFVVSCVIFMAVFFLAANCFLVKRDVRD